MCGGLHVFCRTVKYVYRVTRSEHSAPTASPAPSKGGAFPDGVTLGNVKQRWIRFARLEHGDFVCAFTRARIVGNGQKRDVVLRGHPVFPHDGEGLVVSLVACRNDPRAARDFGLDTGDSAVTKVLACLMLSRATDSRLPSRFNVRNLHGLRPILHRLRIGHMRDIRNLRVVFPADTRAGNWIEDIVVTKSTGWRSTRMCRVSCISE